MIVIKVHFYYFHFSYIKVFILKKLKQISFIDFKLQIFGINVILFKNEKKTIFSFLHHEMCQLAQIGTNKLMNYLIRSSINNISENIPLTHI